MFKHGEELVLTHENGISEPVKFVEFDVPLEELVSAGSTYPDEPEADAIVRRSNDKEITVLLRQLSRPD